MRRKKGGQVILDPDRANPTPKLHAPAAPPKAHRNPYSWAKGEQAVLTRELAIDLLDAAESWQQHVTKVIGTADVGLQKTIDELKIILTSG